MWMSKIRHAVFVHILLSVLAVYSPGIAAADLPWRAAEQADLGGTWRQVGVVVLTSQIRRDDPWFQAKQFFRFPEGGFRHVLVNPDSDPKREAPTTMQRRMLVEGPTTQTLTWRSKGIAWLKHPEHPRQRIDFGLYLRDAPSGPKNSPVKPKKGDLILVFYSHKDVNVPVYFRLLRKQP
jgi:hypothetical protein